MTVKESCRTIYNNTYTQETVRLADAGGKNRNNSSKRSN